MLPMLFGFMAIAPASKNNPRVQELATAIRSTLLHVQMQGKALASAMGLSESHLSRQLNEQGVNAARLLNAGEQFWLHFLKPFTELAGLSREQVLEIFGGDAEKDKKDAERDKRIEELERQLAEVLKRLPPSKDNTRQQVA